MQYIYIAVAGLADLVKIVKFGKSWLNFFDYNP